MKHHIVYLLLLSTLLCVQGLHAKNEFEILVTGVQFSQEKNSVQLELSSSLEDRDCQSLLVTSTDQVLQCQIGKLSSRFVECQMPLIPLNVSDNEEFLSHSCQVKCGEFCSELSPASSSFSEDNRQLSTAPFSFAPLSASYIYPSYLTITLSQKYETIKSIYLENDKNTVEAFILRQNSTLVNAIVKGGAPGDYTIKLKQSNDAIISSATTFSLAVKVVSVSPTEGSIKGGVILKIVCMNCSPRLDENIVTIGDATCNVIAASPSLLTCITKVDSAHKPALDTPIAVKISSKAGDSSILADDSPKFTFKEYTETPTIATVGSNEKGIVLQGETVVISGSDLSIPDETTVLRIGDEEIQYSALTPKQLSFIVPFDMTPEKQLLTIHVGKRGATSPAYEIYPSVKLMSSQCFLEGGAYNYPYQVSLSNAYLYFDMNLSSYDPSYTFQVTLDSDVIEAKVTQSATNKNYVNVRLPWSELSQRNNQYSNINAITISGQNAIETPIALTATAYNGTSYQQIIISSVTFSEEQNGGRFVVTITSDFGDLEIKRLLLINADASVEIEGSSTQLWFYFSKLSLADTYFLQGCSNHGTIYYQLPELPSYAYYSASTTWELVDTPFPNNVITPGQTFSARFSQFDLNSDFLKLSCQSYSYPLFWTGSTGDNVYTFEIPPIFIQRSGKIDFGEQLSCTLTPMKGWSTSYDYLVTRHIFEEPSYLVSLNDVMSRCQTTSSSVTVTYQNKDNLVINSYSKDTFSYLGGEELILYGTNLKQTQIDQVEVKINGITCDVVETSTTQIRCVTGAQPVIQLLDAPQVLVYQNNVKALLIPGPINIAFRLVDPIPFYGFLEFKENSKVYIPKHNVVYMDDAALLSDKTVTYDRVLVDGSLVFEATMNYSIICNQLLGVGSVILGSETAPFKDFTMNLKTIQTFDIGKLKAYGDPTSSIVKLSASALKGTKQLSVSSDVLSPQKLKIGDKILVSGTTLGSKEEILTIESLNADSIVVTTALAYDHIVINESITMKDQSTYPFKVAPSLLKLSKTIILNLVNKNRDQYAGSPNSRIFDIHGVEFYLTQQQSQNGWSSTLIASASIFDISMYCNNVNYDQSYPYQMRIQSLDSSLFYDFNKNQYLDISGFTSVATNNLFIGKSQYILSLSYTSINFSLNSFQTTSIYLRPYGKVNTFTDNFIYNTEYCLNLNGDYHISVPLALSNNQCFACSTAVSVAMNQRIEKTKKYSLVAMDISKAAVEIAYVETDYFQQDYELMSLGMVFKAVGAGKTNDKKPLPFLRSSMDRYEAIGVKDVEFIGFTGKIISSDTVAGTQNMLQLNTIKNDFPSASSVFLDSDSQNLVVYDIDGSFLKNNLKGNNIFSNSLNLQSSLSSCQVLSTGFSVCQNYLLHFQQFFLLRNLEGSSQYLKFKRTNGNIIDAKQVGFYAVNGEAYEISLVDDQNKAISLNTFSSMIDYIQNDSLGILLNFQIKEKFIDYFVASVGISSIEQLADITTSQFIAPSTTLLKLETCTHGQNSDQGTYVQVCYKSKQQPLTLQFLFTPDVVPQISLETVISTRKFEEPSNWINAIGKSTQSDQRWTIQSNWNMVLSKGGVYEVPSLVVQGTLEITGSSDITINTKGIYIGAGVIKVSSTFTGKLYLNFKITDPSQVIFRNPFVGGKDMYQGTFAIYNKLIIENTDADTVPYRIKSVIDENTLLLEDNATLAVGLDVIFACPITGQTLQSTISYSKKTGSGTLVKFQEKHGYTLAGFEKITVSSSQYKLSPYLRVLNKRIHIANANFIVENYVLQYIPSMSISGVQFENSSITLTHGIGDISISSSAFLDKSSDFSSGSKDFFFFLDSLYNFYMPQLLNPSVKIAKNVFFGRNKIISVNAMKYFSYDKVIKELEKDMKVSLTLEFTGNFAVKAATAVTSSLGFTAFSDNIFIKSSESCVSSPICFAMANNQFFQCVNVAIDIQSCKSISSNFFAMSGVIYSSSSVTSINDIVSIGNGKLQSNPISMTGGAETLPKLRLTISNSYFVGDVNTIIPSDAVCVPNSTLLSLFADSASTKLAVPEVVIQNTFFAYFQCTKLIQIPSQDYLSSLTFINAKCLHCGYKQLSDVLDAGSGTISSSLLVQDIKSSFFQKIPFALATSSSKQTVITQTSESPYAKLSQTSSILSRLFITQLKNPFTEQTFTAEQTPTYNNQNLFTQKGAALILKINQLYTFSSSTILEKNAFRLSSPHVLTKEYVQLKYKPKDKNGLLIQKSYTTLLPTKGLDTTKGFAILDMVQKDESKIECGTMAYDTVNDEYHIIITGDDDCLIRIFEYATPKLSIVMPTPILPPPPPKQANMCLAERQRLYVIEKLSEALGISSNRIRVLAQSNAGSCSLSKRLLADGDSAETLTFTIIVDSEQNASDSTSENCLLNPACTPSQKSAQDALSQSQNMAIFYQAESLQVKALEKGLVINSVEQILPSLTTSCTGGLLDQEGVCKTSCDGGFYPSGNFCIRCHSACKTCSAQSDHGCKDSLTVGEKDCAEDYKTFTDNDTGLKYCGKCPANCSTCLVSKCPVGSCKDGFVNQNGFCLAKCTSGYFNLQGICVKCQSNCSDTCSQGTCECSTGYFYKQSTTNPVCNACPSQCATCSSEKICLTCLNTDNEPKLQCLTEKYVESAASSNNLGLIIGLTIGIGFAALAIGIIAKSQFAKHLLKKSVQLEQVKYTDTNALQPKEEMNKHSQEEINSNNKNEEESPLGMIQI